MSGRPSEATMEWRRLNVTRDPALRKAHEERKRILEEIARIDTFLAVHEEMSAIPPGHA